MSAIAAHQMRENAGDIDLTGVHVVPLAEDLYGEYRSPLVLLLFAASAVLLVACINLASALLARSAAREREVAVRASLGAGRMRLARQLLTESLLLALLGGLLGLALAVGALRVLESVQPAGVLRMRDMSLGAPIIGFTLAVAVLSSVLFGLIPALRTSDFDVAGLLRGGDRGGTSGHSRLWDVLVAGEVALALVLLVNSALLVRSFREILQPETGFDANGVVTLNAFIPSFVYEGDDALAGIADRLVEEFRRLPGVEAVGFSNTLPGLGLNGGVHLDGKDTEGSTEYRVADAGYFGALRIPLLAGRLFEPTDAMGAPTVALIDKTFADRFYPGENPVGRRIRNLRNDSFRYGEDDWLTIVGVVGSVVPHGQSAGATPTTYVYYRQRPFRAREPVFTFRPGTSTPQLAAQVREVMTRVAPSVPFEIGSASAALEAPLAARRFAMFVIAAFGLLTLVLAAVGIHAVVSWSVQRRTREMGVRIALGAVPRRVARGVVRDAMVIVAIGVGAGILATISTAGLIRGFLVGVGATEPLVLVAMIGVLGLVALVASALPALRVTRIDPVTALRTD
jgi:predicted permease